MREEARLPAGLPACADAAPRLLLFPFSFLFERGLFLEFEDLNDDDDD